MYTIGVLTSGGDAPGMNAAIRAVVRTAKYYDINVKGIRKGFNGLVYGDIFEMNAPDVSDIMQRGGTILQTARCLEFKNQPVIRKAISTAEYFGIDGIVVIGGDGSFRGARYLSLAGMPTICIPGTIDNDITFTYIPSDLILQLILQRMPLIKSVIQQQVMSVAILLKLWAGVGQYCAHRWYCNGWNHLIPEVPYDFEKDI